MLGSTLGISLLAEGPSSVSKMETWHYIFWRGKMLCPQEEEGKGTNEPFCKGSSMCVLYL